MTEGVEDPSPVSTALELVEWRRTVAALYAEARSAGVDEAGWDRWRRGREELFGGHPQSPLATGASLDWFPYDPVWRVAAVVEPAEEERWETAEGVLRRVGTATFTPPGADDAATLALWWHDAYAGGLFLPFRDATSGRSTYGGGRYLLDTAKGADLGSSERELVLDFNFAYNPSCAYDPRWPCPLAPQANVLREEVPVGERSPAL